MTRSRLFATILIVCSALAARPAGAVTPPLVDRHAPSGYEPPIGGTELDRFTSYPHRRLVITTKLGVIKCQLFEKLAPKHVAHFEALAKAHFFDSTTFHRVMKGYMIQGGDPNSKDDDLSNDGYGQPGQETVPAEFSPTHHDRGILSTARQPADVNSATSQFFIMVGDHHSFDKQYTVWGEVVEGMDVVDHIVELPCQNGSNPGKAGMVLSVTVEE